VSNISRKIDGPVPGSRKPDAVLPADRETRYHFGGLIQTDAKLARGTSGGPMLNLEGKMIGLSTNVAMLAGFEKGTGYAIPVDDHFKRSLAKLKRGEAVGQGFLGVAPRNPEASFGERGVVLERVEPGTPAGKAGLFARDQVLRIDGKPIQTIDDLFLQIGSSLPNHVARVEVLRAGKLQTIPVRLTKKPSLTSRPSITTAKIATWRGAQVDFATGLSIRKLPSIDPNGCVVVTQVDRDSAAWAAGLRVGTMISKLNGKRIASPTEFHKVASNLPGLVKVSVYDRFRLQVVDVPE
jgi:serine protease Do